MIKLVDLMAEGRYDRITGLIVDLIWKDINESYEEYLNDPEENDLQMFRHKIKLQMYFVLDVVIKRTMRKGLKIDANVEDDKKMNIVMEIGSNIQPSKNKLLNAKLQDTVRHEIEHLTQIPGINRKRKKISPTSYAERDRISDLKDSYAYFVLPDEIPAMVHGLYRKAKTEHEPLDDEMHEYLKFFVKEKDITRAQMKKIMVIWIKAAKKLVPKAHYSYKLIKKH